MLLWLLGKLKKANVFEILDLIKILFILFCNLPEFTLTLPKIMISLYQLTNDNFHLVLSFGLTVVPHIWQPTCFIFFNLKLRELRRECLSYFSWRQKVILEALDTNYWPIVYKRGSSSIRFYNHVHFLK